MPFSKTLKPMARDRAGDSLGQAKNLGAIGSQPRTFQDSVSKTDLNDLYRIKIGSSSSFKLKLDNLGKAAKLDVEIFTLKGSAQKVLKAIGRTDWSELNAKVRSKNLTVVARSGLSKSSNSISRTLEPAEYYLRIAARKGSTAYKLSVSADSVTNPTAPIAQPVVPVKLGQSWLRQFGTVSNDYAYGVTVVGDNLYLSGSTEGGLSGMNQGGRDSFATLYKTDGTSQWLRQFGTAGSDIATGIAADSAGNYYVGGTDVDSSGFLPDPKGYVTKYNSSGASQWRLDPKVDPKGSFSAKAIAALVSDSAGNTYAAGLSSDSLISPSKAYVSKYDIDKKKIWEASYTLTKSSSATSVAIDASGNVYIAGITNATLSTNVDAPFTGGDVLVAKFSSTGQKLWDKTIASTGAEYARGIAVDPDGQCLHHRTNGWHFAGTNKRRRHR